MSNEKYFITNRHCGLGDALCNVYGAYSFAKKYGGSVVIDWRWLTYNNLEKQRINLFHSIFKIPNEIDGVKFYTFEEVPELHDFDNVHNNYHWIHRDSPERKVSLDEVDKMIYSNKYINVYFINMSCKLGESSPNWISHNYQELANIEGVECFVENYLSFWNNFEVHNNIKRKLDYYRQKYFSSGNVIGVHIRHGNGQIRAMYDFHWYFYDGVKQKIDEILKTEYPAGIDNKKFFICADNKKCTDDFLKLYPNSFSAEKIYLEEGIGPQHELCNNSIMSIQDAFIDMELLSSCELGILTSRSVFNLSPSLKLNRLYFYDRDRYFKAK